MNYPVSEITNKKLPLLELVLADSSIVENICEQTSFADRIRVFMEFIQAVTREEQSIPEFIDYSVKKIYTHKGNITIKELAEDTGYSDRYLRRKFEEFIGMKPKLFCQIVRVQNSLQTLMHRRDFHLMDVLDELGYYDQSHFIGEFKRFNMLPPSQLKKLLMNEVYDIGGII
ncbi:helix-turn-helix transcriptional regulator [Bacillus thermotolerans]|uniref:helix-turn-helix transcriptional regulator n=1 Tax=Bacillus thermotolerans TaxID=1221996 RepID=UPI000591F6EB|nr:Transcriptional regulator, AraC family [Bacillus thermotolerans]